MRVFTVHASVGADPRTRLVAEGFAFWAFLLGPLWLLARGLWLVLLAYAAAAGVMAAVVPDALAPWAGLALQLLLGFHARDLERWTLARRGLADAGVVVGTDGDDALLRLLSARPELSRGAVP